MSEPNSIQITDEIYKTFKKQIEEDIEFWQIDSNKNTNTSNSFVDFK